jgi:dihydrofolate reductase
MIVAVDEQGGFAKDGEIPWNYKEDWEHFKTTTKDAICIMGRKTYEDILDRKPKKSKSKTLLVGRTSYIVTSNTNQDDFAGVEGIAPSVRQILDKLDSDDDRNIFVLGGEKLYIQHIVWASRVYVTVVPGIYNCTRFFPVDYLHKNFLIAGGEEKGELKFITYHRK